MTETLKNKVIKLVIKYELIAKYGTEAIDLEEVIEDLKKSLS